VTPRRPQLHFGAFLLTPGNHGAGWRHPDAEPTTDMDFNWYVRLARKAEAGKLDCVFFQDTAALNGSGGLDGKSPYRPSSGRQVHREPVSSAVWMNRTKWDMTTWEMVGRPERSDPDELLHALFHSSLAENGYDFVGYKNPDYDRLAEAQRAELDRTKREALVKDAQMMIARDQP